jgi:hypothetical protein
METFDPNTGEVTIPKAPVSITEVIDEGIKKQADMARKGLDPADPDDYIKDREPKAKGGLTIGIGTMFRKRGR